VCVFTPFSPPLAQELTKADLGSSDEHAQAQEAIDQATALLKKEGIALDD
jgi:hypothetical protein